MSTTEKDVKVFAVCSSLLYVKFLATTHFQSIQSYHAGTRAPEDNNFPLITKGKPTQALLRPLTSAVDDNKETKKLRLALEDELRWKRIVQNDVESIPLALAIFGGAIAVGSNSKITSTLMITYTVARYLHTIMYVKRSAYGRLVGWVVGVACILGAGATGVSKALRG